MPDHRKSSSGFKGIFENRKIDGQCCFCISTEQEVYTCPVVVTEVGWSGCMEEDGWVERYNLSQPEDT